MNEQDQLIHNLKMALEWLNNLEKHVEMDVFLDAMPNNWGGRNAIEAWNRGELRSRYHLPSPEEVF